MSKDLIELEPLLGQYDVGKIVVGPLLNLSLGSNFRYFYIAGKGSKIYGSVGLGFVEAEDEAEGQRVEIVDKLKSRFREVVTLGGHLEMAQAVHKLWPNDETVRILELAALQAELTQAPHERVGGRPVGEAPPGDAGQDFAAVAKRELVDPVWGDNPPPVQGLPQAVPSSRAPGLAPSRLPDVSLSWPINDDRAAPPQQQQSARNDVFPAPVLGLQSLIPTATAPEPFAGQERLASTIVRLAGFGSVVLVLVGMVVVAATRQVADEAGSTRVTPPSIAGNLNNGPSQASAATGSMTSSHTATVNEPAPPATPGRSLPPPTPPSPVASTQVGANFGPPSQPPRAATPTGSSVSAPQSQPARVASAGAATAPVSEPQSQPPQVATAPAATAPRLAPQSSPAIKLDADATAMLMRRADDFVKSGDFASARLLLRRATEAGSADAALMLGATFDPRIIRALGPIGIEPDIAQARQWYEKAAELGSADAAQRLTRLTQTGQ